MLNNYRSTLSLHGLYHGGTLAANPRSLVRSSPPRRTDRSGDASPRCRTQYKRLIRTANIAK